VFTARYALSPYIKQICFVFKRLILEYGAVTLSVFLWPHVGSRQLVPQGDRGIAPPRQPINNFYCVFIKIHISMVWGLKGRLNNHRSFWTRCGAALALSPGALRLGLSLFPVWAVSGSGLLARSFSVGFIILLLCWCGVLLFCSSYFRLRTLLNSVLPAVSEWWGRRQTTRIIIIIIIIICIVILPVFCMGVKLGLLHWGRNKGWGCVRTGCWGGYLGLRGTRRQGSGEDCITISLMFYTHHQISFAWWKRE
jgi:hypothetical protein